MKSQLKQIEQSEQIQKVFPSDHKIQVSFLDVADRKVVLVTQKESHIVGKSGMISLSFHEYQTKQIKKILKKTGYTLNSTSVNTQDYVKIGHEDITTSVTLHFGK